MGFGNILGNIIEMRKAAKYRKMGANELLRLDEEDFYDAVDCLTSDAVEYDINNPDINPEQRWVYSLISFEREVNNGGLCQFFVNSSGACAPFISEALEQVGALHIKDVYESFLTDNNIDPGDLSFFQLESIDDYSDREEAFDFDQFDDFFYENGEDFHDRMIAYARDHIDALLKA